VGMEEMEEMVMEEVRNNIWLYNRTDRPWERWRKQYSKLYWSKWRWSNKLIVSGTLTIASTGAISSNGNIGNIQVIHGLGGVVEDLYISQQIFSQDRNNHYKWRKQFI